MNGASTAKVFLLAQNRLVREALTKVFARKNDVRVVGSQALSDGTMDEVVAASPDVLVMDSHARSTAG